MQAQREQQGAAPRQQRLADVTVSVPQLQQLAAVAAKAGQNVFSLPPQPVPIDGVVRLFYNRAQGPLPEDSDVVVRHRAF